MTSRRLLWALVAVFISMFAVAGGNIIYTQRAVHRDQQQWCDVVRTLDDAYHSQPPQSATGRQLAADIHSLRQQFECPEAQR